MIQFGKMHYTETPVQHKMTHYVETFVVAYKVLVMVWKKRINLHHLL